MKTAYDYVSRSVAFLTSIALLMCMVPAQVEADGPEVIISIHQPSVWSLGQAHYLLAEMHKRNRGLKSKLPDQDLLDANRAHGSRILGELSSFSLDAQFDQIVGRQNRLALERYQSDVSRKEQAQASLAKAKSDRDSLNEQLIKVNSMLAGLKDEEARLANIPEADRTPEQTARLQEVRAVIKNREEQKAALEGQKTALNEEIGTLTTEANATVQVPQLSTPGPAAGSGSLPQSQAYERFLEKAINELEKPSFDPERALGKHVNLEYVIISLLLTLLRDEVGPENRVVFLELPSSIYTVDRKADNYIGQVEWRVNRFLDDMDSVNEQKKKGIEEKRKDVAKRLSEKISKLNPQALAAVNNALTNSAYSAAKLSEAASGMTLQLKKSDISEEIQDKVARAIREAVNELQSIEDEEEHGPITLDDISAVDASKWRVANPNLSTTQASTGHLPSKKERCKGPASAADTNAIPKELSVRALDIIPRQSALNVNQNHATVRDRALILGMKWLIGLGANLEIRKRRELYEQFIQEDVFASGYGKGSDTFGWTFGPLPGTKRMAPGERTTYAVLAVPRNTLALELVGKGRAYKRDDSPCEAEILSDSRFIIRIPGENTESFWVKGIAYTSVKKGEILMALLQGSYFSPQLGVLVNDHPLKRVTSVARIAGDDVAPQPGSSGITGEFEVLNSHEIIMRFSMGPDYVGTPIITLVTPEKTTPINSFKLIKNFNKHGDKITLKELSKREPMFLEDLKIEGIAESGVSCLKGTPTAAVPANAIYAKLFGKGFRPDAAISVNGKEVSASEHVSTNEYCLMLERPQGNRWGVALNQGTGQGFESASMVHDRSISFAINRYVPLEGGKAEVDLVFTAPGHASIQAEVDETDGSKLSGPVAQANGKFRMKILVKEHYLRTGGGRRVAVLRDRITVTITPHQGSPDPLDINLPLVPTIHSIRRSSGHYDSEKEVIITGMNLQHVARVYFGDRPGLIIGSPAPQALIVRVPRGPDVAQGERLRVPVRLETDVVLNGRNVTNAADLASARAYYEYLGDARSKVASN